LSATTALRNLPRQNFLPRHQPKTLPIKKARRPTQHLIETHAFARKQKQILLERSSGRWRGMWILPPLKLDCFKQSRSSRGLIHTSIFPFTNHRVTLRVFTHRARKIDNRRQRWFEIGALDSIPIPSPHRRAISSLLQ